MSLAVLNNDQVHHMSCLLAGAEAILQLRQHVEVCADGRRYRLFLNDKKIQVLSRRTRDWQPRASEPLASDTFAVVLVDLATSPTTFYPIPGSWFREDIARRYAEYLKLHGGRPRNPDSDHFAVKTHMVEQWRDRWDVLTGAEQ